MLFVESNHRRNVSRLVSWGHWFAFYNIVVAFCIASIYVFSSPLPDSLLGKGYLIANWIGHISFLTFIGFIIFIIPLCYLLSNNKVVKGISSVFAALGQALLALDALFYNKTGVHISLSSTQMALDETTRHASQLTSDKLLFFIVLFFVWLGFQLIIANAIWQRIERFKRKRIGQSLIGLCVGCFVFSHAVHVWADAKLYQPIIKQDNMFPLSYPATAKTTLSRYGLLDMDDYKQRRSLSFVKQVSSLNYPIEPFFCGVSLSRPFWIFTVTDGELDNPSITASSTSLYYHSTQQIDVKARSVFYGLPSVFHDNLSSTSPLLFDLLADFAIPVYIDAPTNTFFVNEYIRTNTFSAPEANELGVYVSFISAERINAIPAALLDNVDWMVLYPSKQSQSSGLAHSSIDIASQLVMDEDVAPSLIQHLGCDKDPQLYSTGQNIFNADRGWHITTADDAVIVFDGQTIANIKANGLTEVRSIQTGNLVNQELNTTALNRGLKQLSQFVSEQ